MSDLAGGQALLNDAALVDVGAWQVITATGADRLSFLHRLLTSSLDGLLPGQGKRALLLNIKGHVVIDLGVLAQAESVLLLVPPGEGEASLAALSRYAIMDDVAMALLPDRKLLALYGPSAAAKLAGAGIAVPPEVAGGPALAHADVVGPAGPVLVVRTPGYGSTGFWVLGDAGIDDLRTALGQAGVATLPNETAEALRILAGEPKFGVDITADVFPMEVGLDPVIDYSKGCYLGQEPIVRIRDRGHINWRLVGLRLAEDAPIVAGDRLESDARPKAGRVTSAARLPGQAPVALGLVHVSIPVGTTVRVRHEDRAVAAEVVPAAGASGASAPG